MVVVFITSKNCSRLVSFKFPIIIKSSKPKIPSSTWVTLDQYIYGDTIVNSILNKVAGKIKFLYRHSHYLKNYARIFALLFFQCHIDSCCTSWYSGLNMSHQRNLQIIENKMARFILNLCPKNHIGQVHLDSIKVLKVHDRVKQLRLNLVFSANTINIVCW